VPGPGPLPDAVRLAALHAAILAPSLGRLDARWSLFAAAFALPFFATAGWGRPPGEIRDALVLAVSAAACGAAGARRRQRAYLPSVILLFVLPFALGYLCEEFGRADAAAAWRNVSPWTLHAGAGVLLLWAWPVYELARRRA